MNKADILIDVHPHLSEDHRQQLETEIITLNGVLHAHFDHKHPKSHGLFVQYNPQAITSHAVLDEVRQWDPQATMSGL